MPSALAAALLDLLISLNTTLASSLGREILKPMPEAATVTIATFAANPTPILHI